MPERLQLLNFCHSLLDHKCGTSPKQLHRASSSHSQARPTQTCLHSPFDQESIIFLVYSNSKDLSSDIFCLHCSGILELPDATMWPFMHDWGISTYLDKYPSRTSCWLPGTEGTSEMRLHPLNFPSVYLTLSFLSLLLLAPSQAGSPPPSIVPIPLCSLFTTLLIHPPFPLWWVTTGSYFYQKANRCLFQSYLSCQKGQMQPEQD